MEVNGAKFSGHVTKLSTILQKECNVSRAGPLVINQEFQITIPNGSTPPFQKVSTDLGHIESALELPVLTGRHKRRYWVGLRESWERKDKHKIRFVECSLRLYVGSTDQEPAHFLRLEWVAKDHSGFYQGKHAGHPHWHIDRLALAGNKALSRSLEDLTAPDQPPELEEFGVLTVSRALPQVDLFDCSWVQNIHLPAHAGWMNKWNGTDIPGPHQSEPDNFEALENWWAGSLRYFVHELSSLRI
jgi:hypothetical protein